MKTPALHPVCLRTRTAKLPQRNGDPVNAAIVSKYSTNAALTGRRIDL
jgi:hypothetical protein